MVMIQTPTTKLVFRSDTTCGSPTTTMLESRVAMKIPTVVTVRTTHLYSNRNRHTTSSIFQEDRKNHDINSGRRTLKPLSFPQLEILMGLAYKRDFAKSLRLNKDKSRNGKRQSETWRGFAHNQP